MPQKQLGIYKQLLSYLCNADQQVLEDFSGYSVDDPYSDIKNSLEKTVELLLSNESLVASFLVQGSKKLFIESKRHPRPSVIMKSFCELLYQVRYTSTRAFIIRVREICWTRRTCPANFENVRQRSLISPDKMSSEKFDIRQTIHSEMSCENSKCPAKNCRFTGQDVRRGSNEFRVLCLSCSRMLIRGLKH